MINQAVLYLLWIRCLQDSKEFQRLVRKLYPEISVDDADSIVAEYLKKQAEWQAELNRACDVIEDFMEREPGGVSSQNQEQVEEIMANTTTVKTEAK